MRLRIVIQDSKGKEVLAIEQEDLILYLEDKKDVRKAINELIKLLKLKTNER